MKSVRTILLILVMAVVALGNTAPVVTNVNAVQLDGTRLVQVTYDVLDADDDKMTISLQISADAGATWTVPVFTTSGDVGDSIESGSNYEIIWNAGMDYPEQSGTEYKAKVIACDNAPPDGMVRVANSTYVMGSATIGGTAIPEHSVTVPTFFIDIYEVTNSQYKIFCDATGYDYPLDPYWMPPLVPYFINPACANYPVVLVSWEDAHAYAAWCGKRLPTEAEWELAAKGAADNRLYPWGDTWISSNANTNSGSYTYTAPVDSCSGGISPAGCYNMAGNVYEWVEDDRHDDYSGAPTDGSAWIDEPRGTYRIIRGGSWDHVNSLARCAYRWHAYPAQKEDYLGFRCAKTP
ncbi:formylglycine-generating enzyme family protein [bacterium]|nr:formylglycine-generating enzyme family protein [bacterium]